MPKKFANTTKITSGALRGRTIKTPPSSITHPMGARERLALFNIITPFGVLDNVLDAFAGSGALGFEALSRGAKNVTFVEQDHSATNTIRDNITALGIESNATILEMPVENLPLEDRYTLVLADPPYNHYNPQTIEHLLPLIKKNGLFVLSHPQDITPLFNDFRLIKHTSYAAAHISVFQKL